MKKRKQPPRELTQWQLDNRAYSAFRHQAYLRTLTPHLPYADPTDPTEPEEAHE